MIMHGKILIVTYLRTISIPGKAMFNDTGSDLSLVFRKMYEYKYGDSTDINTAVIKVKLAKPASGLGHLYVRPRNAVRCNYSSML